MGVHDRTRYSRIVSSIVSEAHFFKTKSMIGTGFKDEDGIQHCLIYFGVNERYTSLGN